MTYVNADELEEMERGAARWMGCAELRLLDGGMT